MVHDANIRQDPVWVKSYTPGVPATIDFGDVSSFRDLLGRSLKKYAHRAAVECLGVTWTYGRLDRDAARLAAWLQSRGVRKGARVAVMMPSIPQYLVCLIAVLRAGCVLVNVNPLYTPRELQHQLVDSGAEAIIILDQFAGTLSQVHTKTALRHVVVTSIGDIFQGPKGMVANFVQRHMRKAVPKWHLPEHHKFGNVIAAGASLHLSEPPLCRDDIAVLQYTGGTTGVAKGAILSHRCLMSATLMMGAWLQPMLHESPSIDAPIFLIPLPLYHVFTLAIVTMGLVKGACCELVPNPRDTVSLIKTMQASPFHLMIGLNTLYASLMAHEGFRKVDMSSARAFIAGGMTTHRAVAEQWYERTGHWIIEGWGMTEIVGAGSCNPYPARGFNGSIGLPFPSVLLSIRDSDGGEVGIGQAGEIWIAGPQVMDGYWGRLGETESPFDANGYLATGDVGVMDEDGFVTIIDRKKDMILVSGFNVYPNEIEGVAVSMPGILEVAAISVPDDKTGEAVKLFLVRKDPSITVDDVRRHCEASLTNYKRPRHIVFVDNLPKSPVGKILRRELRDL